MGSLGFNWVHLALLGLTRVHLGSLMFPRILFGLLGFILDPCALFKVTWMCLSFLRLTWVFLDSQ